VVEISVVHLVLVPDRNLLVSPWLEHWRVDVVACKFLRRPRFLLGFKFLWSGEVPLHRLCLTFLDVSSVNTGFRLRNVSPDWLLGFVSYYLFAQRSLFLVSKWFHFDSWLIVNKRQRRPADSSLVQVGDPWALKELRPSICSARIFHDIAAVTGETQVLAALLMVVLKESFLILVQTLASVSATSSYLRMIPFVINLANLFGQIFAEVGYLRWFVVQPKYAGFECFIGYFLGFLTVPIGDYFLNLFERLVLHYELVSFEIRPVRIFRCQNLQHWVFIAFLSGTELNDLGSTFGCWQSVPQHIARRASMCLGLMKGLRMCVRRRSSWHDCLVKSLDSEFYQGLLEGSRFLTVNLDNGA